MVFVLQISSETSYKSGFPETTLESEQLKEENKRLQSKVEKNEKTLQMLTQGLAGYQEILKVILIPTRPNYTTTCFYFLQVYNSVKQKPCCHRETARCHYKFRSTQSVEAVVFLCY